MLKSLDARGFFIPVIAVLLVTDLAVALNIPVLRQVLGFLFLTFLPGFLVVSILKLDKLGLLEKIVLSVGLSVAFLMFYGLAVNSSLLAIGYIKPLSTIPLLISFGLATIALAIVARIRNKNITFSFSKLRLTTGEKAFLIVPSLLPLLSIVGMRIMNLNDNNIILMVLLFLIPAYVIFVSFLNRRVPENVYPIAIFLISISLLLMYSLRSNHILGADQHTEYYILQITLDNLHWSQLGFNLFDTCLSISLLPAIYQTFLNINPEYLFKILYSLIFSISPLVVYILSKKYIGSFYAFLASVFFMSQKMFLWTPAGHTRTHIAVLFFALIIMVLFHDNIGKFGKRALLIIFAMSILISHYATSYIVFFVLLFTWAGMQILSRITSPQTRLKMGITSTFMALFLTTLFMWFSQMTGPTFRTGVHFIKQTFVKWEQFFVLEERGAFVQAGFGEGGQYFNILPQRMEIAFSWLTILFIAIGVLVTMGRFKRMVSFSGDEKPSFLMKKFDAEYLMLSIACSTLLVVTVVLPYIGKGYDTSRTYFQMMVLLSTFFVTGGIIVAKYLKSRPYLVILVVLIPYFLCTSGAIAQLFGFPRDFTLNSEGFLYDTYYVHDQENYSARWIKEYAGERTAIYITRGHLLVSQGKIPWSRVRPLISTYQEGKEIDGFIYLRHTDIGDDGLVVKYPDLFAGKSKIYSNGGSEVYKGGMRSESR